MPGEVGTKRMRDKAHSPWSCEDFRRCHENHLGARTLDPTPGDGLGQAHLLEAALDRLLWLRRSPSPDLKTA
jgi:hypothetical protein